MSRAEPEPLEQIDFGHYKARRTRRYSPSSVSKVIFNENTRQWFVGVLMALSIFTNVLLGTVLWNKYNAQQQTDDLRRYDLDFFKQNDWATLKSQVETQGKLIDAYGLQKAVRDAANQK